MSLIKPKLLKWVPGESGIYLVGGTVRDLLLGRPTADYDLAVEKNAAGIAQTIAAAAGSRAVKMGRPGRCVYRVVCGTETYDISDIQGQGIVDDLLRRDFTINAMAVNLKTSALIDPAGGRNDLGAGRVRMVSEAALDADPLRLLRAFRMAAALDFAIDAATLRAVSRRSGKIRQAAGERIREEWLRLLQSPSSAGWLAQMDRAGLLAAVFPEVGALRGCSQNSHHRGDVLAHTLAVCRGIDRLVHENDPPLAAGQSNRDLLASANHGRLLKHAALLHDIGKPQTRTVDRNGGIHFYGHQQVGAEMAERANRRLRFSNAENRYVCFIIAHHLRPLFLLIAREQGKLTCGATARFFMKTAPLTTDLLLFFAADMAGGKHRPGTSAAGFAADLLGRYRAAFGRPPLVTGHDLIRLGLCPSARFAKILRQIEVKRLAGEIETRDQALAEVQKIIRAGADGT